MNQLDIQSNRGASKYTVREQFARIMWAFGAFLFAISPRPCFRFRSWLLRRFGAKVGDHVHIYPTARICFPWLLIVGNDSAIGDRVQIYNLGLCRIGSRATISQGSHLCGGTHDYTDPTMPLERCTINIGDDVWICADAFIGPTVSIGAGSVVGARSVVTKDVEPWIVVAGNPAKRIRTRVLRNEAGTSTFSEASE